MWCSVDRKSMSLSADVTVKRTWLWSIWHLLSCQVCAIVGDSGLCCCVPRYSRDAGRQQRAKWTKERKWDHNQPKRLFLKKSRKKCDTPDGSIRTPRTVMLDRYVGKAPYNKRSDPPPPSNPLPHTHTFSMFLLSLDHNSWFVTRTKASEPKIRMKRLFFFTIHVFWFFLPNSGSQILPQNPHAHSSSPTHLLYTTKHSW